MIMKRVLILEDDQWFADSLTEILANEFDVRICLTADECLGVMESWLPDIIVSDVILGNQNAFVLLNEFQSHNDWREIPVVLLTANAVKVNLDDVRNMSVRAILDKAKITPKNLCANLHSIRNKAQND